SVFVECGNCTQFTRMLSSPLHVKYLFRFRPVLLFEPRSFGGVGLLDSHGDDLAWRKEEFMRRRFQIVLAMLAVALLASVPAFAQGGGASSTGSINGKVADSSAAMLPGVTVTASSPSLMGVQTSVTDAAGLYRFPAVPPGTYTLTFELPGFNTLKRENIQIALGSTASVNGELTVASLNETVTVTGDSPVIDTSNTRVQ